MSVGIYDIAVPIPTVVVIVTTAIGTNILHLPSILIISILVGMRILEREEIVCCWI